MKYNLSFPEVTNRTQVGSDGGDGIHTSLGSLGYLQKESEIFAWHDLRKVFASISRVWNVGSPHEFNYDSAL